MSLAASDYYDNDENKQTDRQTDGQTGSILVKLGIYAVIKVQNTTKMYRTIVIHDVWSVKVINIITISSGSSKHQMVDNRGNVMNIHWGGGNIGRGLRDESPPVGLGANPGRGSGGLNPLEAEAVFRLWSFWLQKRSKLEKFRTFHALILDQSVSQLSLIHIWRCRRSYACRSRWSPYH